MLVRNAEPLDKKGGVPCRNGGEGLLAYAGPTKLERFYTVHPHLSQPPAPAWIQAIGDTVYRNIVLRTCMKVGFRNITSMWLVG